MSETICTCHCGGAMFYRHLHAESCALSREGEEAPKSELQALRDERDRLREALEEIARDIAGSPKRKLMLADDNFWATPGEHTLRQWIARAALTPGEGGQDE